MLYLDNVEPRQRVSKWCGIWHALQCVSIHNLSLACGNRVTATRQIPDYVFWFVSYIHIYLIHHLRQIVHSIVIRIRNRVVINRRLERAKGKSPRGPGPGRVPVEPLWHGEYSKQASFHLRFSILLAISGS